LAKANKTEYNIVKTSKILSKRNIK